MSLKVWLPLNGDLENRGCSDINIINSGATIDNNGKIGKCYNFVSNYLSFQTPFSKNISEFSICGWVNLNSGYTKNYGFHLISFGLSYGRICISKDGAAIRVLLSNGENVGSSSTAADTTLSAGIWNHFAITFSKGELKFYINGILDRTTTLSFTSFTYTSNELRIGTYGSENANGKANDIRIYDHALSAAEVREISQGLVLHYKLDGFFGGAGENLVINGDARNGLTGWGNWETATERKVVTINNKNWFTFKTDSTGKVGGISQDRGIALYKPNTQYTVSALMYASANVQGRLWVHTRSTEGGANLAQYLTTVNVTTIPNKYTFTFNTGSNSSYTINRLHVMVGAVNATSTLDFYISDIKVEEGIQATSWVPCKEESGYDLTKIEDSSGYNNHGILNDSSAQYVIDSTRYNQAIKNSQPNNSSIYLIKGECNMPDSDALTFSWWMNPTTFGHQTSGLFSTSNSNASDHGTTAANMRDSCFDCCNISGTNVRINVANYLTLNEWHHYTLTYNGSQLNFYKDGISKVIVNQTGALKSFKYIYLFYSCAGGAHRCTSGQLSDFRIYCTALYESDIKQLYNTNLKIDDKNNIHTFTIEESNLNSDQITKTGNLKSINFNENGYLEFLHYDKEIYTEPDGSKWVHVFHHNNPAATKFDNPNQDWLHGKYISADAWYDLEPIVSNLVNYEFLYRQKATDTGSITTYRWTQPIDPVIATWVDVSPSSGNVVYNTSTGYTNSNMGGMYLMKSSQLHMCIANASNGNWFGGLGVSTAYQGGIPGFPNTVVTTGCIDLYVRIYLPTKLIKDKGISTLQYIEK